MARYLEQLTADMKSAMKSGDKPRLEVIRMVISDIKKKAEASKDELDAEAEVVVLQKAVKTRTESVVQAKAAGRAEIAAREQSEIEMLQGYLPKQMSADEVADKVKAIAGEIGYSGPKDTGRFMKEWMSKYKGLADGKAVQAALRNLAE